MKRTLLLTLALLVGFSITAQQKIIPCYTDEHQDDILQEHPEWRDDFEQAREALLSTAAQNHQDGMKKSSGTVYTIPVVVHVLHNTPYDNISRAQIMDGLRVLNEDFRRQNLDASATRSIFQGRAADIEVEFTLAKLDPNGNCTDGITRTQSPLSVQADPRDDVKSLIQWNPDKYLNIWVVNSIKASSGNGVTLGYANFPWMPRSKDGVVLRHDAMGQIGTSVYGGRTLTHEVGHYLGLLHPFQSGCNRGDGVGDTPPVASASFGCNLNRNSCSNDSPNMPDMVENFMDYADGECQNAFTLGQKSVMRTSLRNDARRKTLWTESNLAATGVSQSSCEPVAAFSANKNYTCTGSSITFTDNSEQGVPTSYAWEFPGGTPSTSTDREPTIQYDYAGNYDVTLTVSNAAGSSTVTYSHYVDVKPYYSGNMAQWSEDFEDAQNLSDAFLSVVSMSDTVDFKVSDKAAARGNHSLKLENYGVDNENEVDEFISPVIFTQFGEGTFLTFDYAFAASQSMNTDQLKVFASTDCGETWNLLKVISAGGLRSVALPVSNSEFIPLNEEWKSSSIPLIAYKNNGPVILKFQFINGGGNNFYLDNINVTSSNISVDENALTPDFSVYPNPSNGKFTVEFGEKLNADAQLLLRNLSGQTLRRVDLKKGSTEHHFEDMNLPAGVYLLDIKTSSRKLTHKIMLQ